MRDFKNEQITFYCSCVGELYKGEKAALKERDLDQYTQKHKLQAIECSQEERDIR